MRLHLFELLIPYNVPEILPQTDCKKTLAETKFGSGASVPFIKKRCRFSLEVLEQSHKFENLQEIKVVAC